MEASSYLAPGFLVRKAMAKSGKTRPLSELATPWMPKRLKGIQVDKEHGVPFLAATQLLDRRPRPRKWLSKNRTPAADERFVKPGTILVTCSGTVGRATIASAAQAGCIVSHDLLRFAIPEPEMQGWIYGYLRSNQARAMMLSSHYGHIIKHLEVEHMAALPMPIPDDNTLGEFESQFDLIHEKRTAALAAVETAEAIYEEIVGVPTEDATSNPTTIVDSGRIFGGRRRFEGAYHIQFVEEIRAAIEKTSLGAFTISEAGYRAWLPNRFSRISAKAGIPLLESGALFEVNPDLLKRISERALTDDYKGRVEANWILMARSGQTYGINGCSRLVGCNERDSIVSDDIIRLQAGEGATLQPGALLTALTHPILGLPLVKALAYGSSIPHIECNDVEALRIPRMEEGLAAKMDNLQKTAQRLWDEADAIERSMGERATQVILQLTGAAA